MKISALSTGSKANCTYIEAQGSAILIDCGLSAKKTLERMQEANCDPAKVKAIFVTHEHGDHIKGISVLSRKLGIPVFANSRTAERLSNVFELITFENSSPVLLESFEVLPFSIVHDAVDPVGYKVTAGGQSHLQLTDLGRITKLVQMQASDCQSMILEANYDQRMLNDCPYPWSIKQRISSTYGHLSNEDAAMFLASNYCRNIEHLVLGHLSENSNNPELALESAAEFNDFSRFKRIECGSIERSTLVRAA